MFCCKIMMVIKLFLYPLEERMSKTWGVKRNAYWNECEVSVQTRGIEEHNAKKQMSPFLQFPVISLGSLLLIVNCIFLYFLSLSKMYNVNTSISMFVCLHSDGIHTVLNLVFFLCSNDLGDVHIQFHVILLKACTVVFHWMKLSLDINEGLVLGLLQKPRPADAQVSYIKWCRTMYTVGLLHPWILNLRFPTADAKPADREGWLYCNLSSLLLVGILVSVFSPFNTFRLQ